MTSIMMAYKNLSACVSKSLMSHTLIPFSQQFRIQNFVWRAHYPSFTTQTLKTAQFINLNARSMQRGSSAPLKSAPGSQSPMQFSSMLHLYYYFYFSINAIIIVITIVMLFIYIKSLNPKSNPSFNFNRFDYE